MHSMLVEIITEKEREVQDLKKKDGPPSLYP